MDEQEENKSEQEKELFRSELAERSSDAAQLDMTVQIVGTKAWVSLLTAGMILIAMLLWSFFGSIPIKVEGRGMIINSSGLFSVQSKSTGTVKNLLVKSNDIVDEGQLIAVLNDPEIDLKYRNIVKKIAKAEETLQHIEKEISSEKSANVEAINKDIKAKQYTVEQINIIITDLENEVRKKSRLVEEGLISKNILKADEDKLSAKKIELETIQASIASLKAQAIKSYRTEDYQKKESELLKAKKEKELLETKIALLKVFSPFKGKILEWLVNPGDYVVPGTPLVWVEHSTERTSAGSHIVLGYVPVEKGKRISVGDSVQILPSSVNVQEYGYMLGKVTSVSLYAISKKNIARVIQNEGLSEYLTNKNDVVIQITVEPIPNPDDPSGYTWSSGTGPAEKISTGTICTLQTTVQRIRPFYYVIPLQRLRDISRGGD